MSAWTAVDASAGADVVPPSPSTLPQQPAFKQEAHGTYRPFTAFCFTVNYILGVGVLGMPHGFVSAGWLLALITLAVITVVSWVTGMWIVQVQDRARRALLHTHTSQPREPYTPSTIDRAHSELEQHDRDRDRAEADGYAEPLMLSADEPSQSDSTVSINGAEAIDGVVVGEVPSVLSRRLEVNELVGLFCGKHAQRAYEICLSVLIVGALWAYGTITTPARHRLEPRSDSLC